MKGRSAGGNKFFFFFGGGGGEEWGCEGSRAERLRLEGFYHIF